MKETKLNAWISENNFLMNELLKEKWRNHWIN